MVKKKSGRKPREGVVRGATGKIKTSEYEREQKLEEARQARDAASMGQWMRAKQIVAALLPDSRLPTPLGRMFLLGKPGAITLPQYEAGERLFQILESYDRNILGQHRSPPALDMDRVRGRGNEEADLSGLPEAEREKIMRRYKAISAGLMEVESVLLNSPNGRVVAEATKALVRGTEWDGRWREAIQGLQLLADHWRLTDVPQKIIREAARVQRGDVERRIRSLTNVRV